MQTYFIECLSNWPAPGRSYYVHLEYDVDELSCDMYWLAEVEANSEAEAIELAKENKGKMLIGKFSKAPSL